jgi:hypothetical protein
MHFKHTISFGYVKTEYDLWMTNIREHEEI